MVPGVWHTVLAGPALKTGWVTTGVITTDWLADEVPEQPAPEAVPKAEMVAVPVNPGLKTAIPDVAPIVPAIPGEIE